MKSEIFYTNFPKGHSNDAVFAPIEDWFGAKEASLTRTMKRPLEEATELFRQNEALAGGDQEKANFYRGLGLLAEGLRRIERELAEVESEMQQVPSKLSQRRRLRPLSRFIRGFTPNV